MSLLLANCFKKHLLLIWLLNIAVITCLSLTITNGEVTYSQDNITVGTVATYTCDTGYSLMGLPTQQCVEDDQSGPVGVWNGTAPSCEGKSMFIGSELTT